MKKLYKIGHIIEKFNITARTIRYYDELNLLPNVKRSEGGVRLFDSEDITIINQIMELKSQGLSLKEIKEKFTESPANQPVHIITNSISFSGDSTSIISNIDCKIYANNYILNTQENLFWSNIYSKNWNWKVNFNTTIETLKSLDPQTQFFYIYNSNTPKSIHQKIIKELKDHSIHYFELPINGLGFCSDLIINEIIKTIETSAIKDPRQMIQESITLSHEIIALNSLDYQLTGNRQKKSKSPFSLSLESVIPIYETNLKKLKLQKACINEEETIETLIELCLKEIQNRRNYIRRIKLSYGYHYRIAQTVLDILKDHIHPDKCYIEECTAEKSIYCGERFISIAII